MKKLKLICLIVVLVKIKIFAQPYGEVTYQHTPQAVLSSGAHALSGTGDGFIIGGYIRTTTSSNMNFSVERTSQGGQYLSNTWEFQKEYQTFINSGCTTTPPQIMDCYGVSVIPTSVPAFTGAYALAGANSLGVYYVLLDAAGIPVNSQFFTYPGGPYNVTTKPMIIESTINPQTFFIVGNYGGSNVFAIKIDGTTGTTLATINKVFPDPVQINDILESPYTGNQVVMVGSYYTTTNGKDAFFTSVDQGLTSFIANNAFDVNLGQQELLSVEVCNSTNGSPAGFIVGGYNDGSTSVLGRAMVAKLSTPAGVANWVTTIEGVVVPQNGKVVKVLERKNTSINYEYYALAEAGQGVAVYKLDDLGNPFGSTYPTNFDEFIYQNSNIIPVDLTLSSTTSAPDLGLHIFGSEITSPTGVYHFIESYFNGLTGCNASTYFSNYDISFGGGASSGPSPAAALGGCPNFGITYNTVGNSAFLCGPLPSVTGGNNNKPTGIVNEKKSDDLYITIKQDKLQDCIIVNFPNSEKSGEVFIYSINGDLCDKTTILSGNQSIKIMTKDLVNGIYLVKCTDGIEFRTSKIVISR